MIAKQAPAEERSEVPSLAPREASSASPETAPSDPLSAEPGRSGRRTRRPARHLWWIGLLLGIGALLVWRATEGEAGPSGGFEVGRAVPVRAAVVARGGLDLISSYPGELVGEVADIASQVSGLLREIPVRIGDHVEQGQLLALIDDVDLRNQMQEARGQLGVAEANERRSAAELESAEADHRRASGLFEANLISEQEFDRVSAQLATARANVAASEAQRAQSGARLALLEEQLANSRVLAPFSGSVAARHVDRGVLVQPGTPILRLAESSSLRVQFRVPERDLGIVRPGVNFTATTVATGERNFIGTVERISGEVSRSDRTAVVEGELSASDDILKPGMYAQVEVRLRELRDAMIVPDAALIDRVGMDGVQVSGVFVVDAAASDEESEEGYEVARWVDVSLLGAAGGRAAIEGELDEGDSVLTLGHSDLADGAAIRVVQTEVSHLREPAYLINTTGAAP